MKDPDARAPAPAASAEAGHADAVGGSRLALGVVAMGTVFLATVDMSIVVVALPRIRHAVGATVTETSFFVSAYLVANLCLVPLSGALIRRFGYRGTLARGLGLFAAASLLCAVAGNAATLICGRFLQGLGGGLMMPAADALLIARFPASERAQAAALSTLGRIGGPLFGPALGGLLVDELSWHFLFLINLPIVAALLFWGLPAIRESRPASPPTLGDGTTIFLLCAWLLPLQIVLEEGPRRGGLASVGLQALLVLAGVSFLVWLGRSLTIAEPPVRLRLLRDRRLACACLLNALAGAVVFAAIFLFTLYCGERLGYTARQTGWLLAQAALFQTGIVLAVGRWARWLPAQPLMWLGTLLLAFSLFEYTHLAGREGPDQLLWPQLLRAAGLVLILVPNRSRAFAHVPPAAVGDANALLTVSYELGGSLALALTADWLGTRILWHNAALRAFSGGGLQAQTNTAWLQAQTNTAWGSFGPLATNPLVAEQARLTTLSHQAAFGDAFAVLVWATVGIAVVLVVDRVDSSP